MNILEIPDLSEGYMMMAVGMSVVFAVLLLLFISFNQLKQVPVIIEKFEQRKIRKEEKNNTQASKPASNTELSADVNAAISMALYLYMNEQHDHESEVVTIRTMQRRYSPWSSKIYGLNILKK